VNVHQSVEERLHDVAEAVKPRLRGVLHQAGFSISLATGTALVILAEGPRQTVAAAIYAAAVTLLFGTSAAYHRGSWSPSKRELMERLDHSMIFVLIAGSYTPFCLVLLDGSTRWAIFGVVWGGATTGVVARQVLGTRGRWLFPALYLLLGYVAVPVTPALLREGGVLVLVLTAMGGVLYTIGAVVYARQKPDPHPAWWGFHEIFHALTIAAFVCHYTAISLVIYRAPNG
jgi:hemolysin III